MEDNKITSGIALDIIYNEPLRRIEFQEQPNVIFGIDRGWLIKINHDGKIEFNTEDYPQFTEDDFAREFIRIVQESIIPYKFRQSLDSI